MRKYFVIRSFRSACSSVKIVKGYILIPCLLKCCRGTCSFVGMLKGHMVRKRLGTLVYIDHTTQEHKTWWIAKAHYRIGVCTRPTPIREKHFNRFTNVASFRSPSINVVFICLVLLYHYVPSLHGRNTKQMLQRNYQCSTNIFLSFI